MAGTTNWRVWIHHVSTRTLFLLLAFINTRSIGVFGFNIDWHSPIIIQTVSGSFGRLNSSDDFGASVTFWKTKDVNTLARIIIGAPKANSTSQGPPSHLTIPEPGMIWQCTLGSIHSDYCEPIVMDPTGNVVDGKFQEWKNNTLLGGPNGIAVSGNDFVACASRLEFWESTNTTTVSRMHGGCHGRATSTLVSLPPPPPARTLQSPSRSHMIPLESGFGADPFQRNGQAGFSIHFTKTSELIMGAPGLQRWRGSIVGYNVNDNSEERFIKRFVTSPYMKQADDFFNYFGYAVTSGNFFGDDNLYYVAGAPRANNLTGNVVVFRVIVPSDKAGLAMKHELNGGQTGAYFGSSLLSIDVNGDGIDDLIIGSPRFTQQRPFGGRLLEPIRKADKFLGYEDEGAVFVYFGSPTQFGKRKATIVGNRKRHSQFGTAIASLGDINKDGLNDFVVSAPYEDIAGVVYIYHGSKTDQSLKTSQVIYGKNIDPNFRGFGVSLASDTDIDNNGFNDIAIGSSHSSQVVVLRSSPVVTLNGRIKFPYNKLPLNQISFELESCVSFIQNGYSKVSESISVSVRMEADAYLQEKRLKFLKKGEFGSTPVAIIVYNQTLVAEQEACVKHFAIVDKPLESSGAHVVFRQNIHLVDDNPKEEVKPRTLKIDSFTGSVSEKGEKFSQFCSGCPVVNSKAPHEFDLILPLAVPCGDDDKCEADLRLDVTFAEINKPLEGFIVGSVSSLSMRITVTNYKETAIQPTLNISWNKITLTRVPAGCSKPSEDRDQITYVCTLGKFLEKDQSISVQLEFDVSTLAATDMNGSLVMDLLLWNVTATTVSDMVNPASEIISLPLIYQADPSILGSRLFEVLNLDLRGENQAKYLVFNHKYDLMMDGLSPVAGLLATFKLPVNLTTENSTIINVRGVDSAEAFSCSTTIGSFSRNDDALLLESDDSEQILDKVVEGGIGGSLTKEKEVVRKSNSTLVEQDQLLVHCDSPFVECMEVKCTANSVYKPGERKEISFVIDISIEDIKQLMAKHGVSAIKVESQGMLLLSPALEKIQPTPDKPDETSAVTLIEREKPKAVSKWIIILAVVIGILILLCLGFCLYSCGCFEEKDAPEAVAEVVPMDSRHSKGTSSSVVGDEEELKSLVASSPLSPFSDVTDPPEFVPTEPTIPEEPEYTEIGEK